MERSGLPFVNVVVHDNHGHSSWEETEPSDTDLNEDENPDNPSKPFLRPVRKYGSHLSRDKDVVAFEERVDEREWEIDDHKIEVNDLVTRYDTNLQCGLTLEQVFKNRKRYGENYLQPPAKPSPFLIFLYNLVGGLNTLLWVANIIFSARFSHPKINSND